MNRKFYTCCVSIFLLTVASFFVSCKSTKKVHETSVVKHTSGLDSSDDKCKLDYKNGKALGKLMKQNELDFKTFSGKLNCQLNSGDEENTFNISVRCRKDSAIWLNISKLGIDALRMLITKDSVKFMIMTSLGGTEKGYFKGDFSYINHALKADLDYDVIQALLVGNSADFLSDSVRMRGGKDREKCLYLLSTTRKRKLNKIIEGKEPKENLQAIWLNPQSWKIVTLEFIDIETNRKFIANYKNFNVVGSNQIPYTHEYSINAEKKINAQLDWTKFAIDEQVSFPYKVPASYEEIKLTEKKQE